VIRKILLVSCLLLFLPCIGFAIDVSLPYSYTFDTDAWVDEYGGASAVRNGATVTHISGSACWGGSGGCAKVTPPTSGDPDGTYGGIGAVNYSAQARIHIRWLMYVGSNFVNCMTSTQGGRGKFILMDQPSRTGMFKFNVGDNGGTKIMVFAVMDDGDVDWVTNTSAEFSDAAFQLSNGSEYNEQWICIEYWHDVNTDETGYYLWTQDGEFNGEQVTVDTDHSVSGTQFSFSYWNNYCSGGDSDSYLLFDNIAASTSYIGPPAGFLGGGDTTAPVLASATIASNGQTLTLVFTEAGSDVNQGSNYNDNEWDIDSTQKGNDIGVTYVSGNGSNTHVYTINQTIYVGDTLNIDFNGNSTADVLEDEAGNDLAAITSGSVTNNSTVNVPSNAILGVKISNLGITNNLIAWHRTDGLR